MPFLHPWKCLVVRRRKRRCFARDMACPGKASIRAEYCANQTKNASPSSLRACAARPTLLSLPLSLFTIEEEPRERPHQHPREHCVRSDHSLVQLGLHAFHGSACLRNNNAQSHEELLAFFFLRKHCITKEGNKEPRSFCQIS